MDTSPKSEIDDGAAERGTRRIRTLEEKLEIVREASKPGASVAAVARKHGMNANLLFGWRRLHPRIGVECSRATGKDFFDFRLRDPVLVDVRFPSFWVDVKTKPHELSHTCR